jgi:hypothetical protein
MIKLGFCQFTFKGIFVPKQQLLLFGLFFMCIFVTKLWYNLNYDEVKCKY